MGDSKRTGSAPSQKQDSGQSVQPRGTGSESQARTERDIPSGIGSSQGQDRPAREEPPRTRPSAGTADVERGDRTPGNTERTAGSEESLVHDPTGAFKERP